MKKVIIISTSLRTGSNSDMLADQFIEGAKAEGKFGICQVGGNWCPWCLRFADFFKIH